MISRTTKKQFTIKKLLFAGLLLGLASLVVLLAVVQGNPPPSPISLPLGDGRILQIEGITHGVEHRMGRGSSLDRLRPWLPGPWRGLLASDGGENTISLDRPGFVVWVSALSAAGQTNVDCQGIRVEFVDRHGDIYGETTRAWFGSPSFWRVGHQFLCYPRDERELTLRVTTWKEGKTSTTTLLNPNPTATSGLQGTPLPQSKKMRDFEIRFTGLNVRTNGQGEKAYYESPARYFEPILQIFQNGALAEGWEAPEWFAEDPRGNVGKFLGIHQPALRFSVSLYPAATNLNASRLIATLPALDIAALNTNLWWDRTNQVDANTVVVLGLCPSGTHSFSDGIHEGSSPLVSGPGGGSPSGWTWSRRQVTPMRAKETHSHYTPSPTIYLRIQKHLPDTITGNDAPSLDSLGSRVAIRLRDELGRFWEAKPDTLSAGIQPFLIELPDTVTNVVPEVVLLPPWQATFDVKTPIASLTL